MPKDIMKSNNMECSHYEKALILNQVYENTLDLKEEKEKKEEKEEKKEKEKEKEKEKKEWVTIPLYPHQRTLVHGMLSYKKNMTEGWKIGSSILNSKLGIIGDPSGTGKTLSMLSFLGSQCSEAQLSITPELTPFSSQYFYSQQKELPTLSIYIHLIIVPQNLYSQWTHDIDEYTTFQYIGIDTRKQIRDNLIEQIRTSQFILVTNKCYRYLQQYADDHHVRWNQIIIDEAATIYMNSSDPPLRFQFMWLITDNWVPFLFKHMILQKSVLLFLKQRILFHPEFEDWLLEDTTEPFEVTMESFFFFKDYLPYHHTHRGYMVLRNSSNHLHKLDYFEKRIDCRSQLTTASINAYYTSRNMELYIDNSIIPYLYRSLQIPCLTLDEYRPFQMDEKQEMLTTKVTQPCSICWDECSHKTVVDCCCEVFCGACILKTIMKQPRCPICRTQLNISQLCCLSNIPYLMNKKEWCLDLFEKERDKGPFLVYSSFDNIYYQMLDEMNKRELVTEKLENNIFSIRKIIRNMKEGKIHILFVSNIEHLHGISLPMISQLIFYHSPSFAVRQALLQLVQRMGRKEQLQIIHLCSEMSI